MNDLIIIFGFLGIAYYIYQDPKHLEIEKYKYQVALIIVIFCMYYVTVSNKLLEGFPKCSHKCDGLTFDECKSNSGYCDWKNKCVAEYQTSCSDKQSRDECMDPCVWSDKKFCVQPREKQRKKCENKYPWDCWINDCDENDCLMNTHKNLCNSKKEKMKCVADIQNCSGKCDINSDIVKECEGRSKKGSNYCMNGAQCAWMRSRKICVLNSDKREKCQKFKTNLNKDKCKKHKDRNTHICSYTEICRNDEYCKNKKPGECNDGCKMVPINYTINPKAECNGKECSADDCCVDSDKTCPINIKINKGYHKLIGSGNIRKIDKCRNKFYNCSNKSYYIKIEDNPRCS